MQNQEKILNITKMFYENLYKERKQEKIENLLEKFKDIDITEYWGTTLRKWSFFLNMKNFKVLHHSRWKFNSVHAKFDLLGIKFLINFDDIIYINYKYAM